jgi:hypothetical protein
MSGHSVVLMYCELRKSLLISRMTTLGAAELLQELRLPHGPGLEAIVEEQRDLATALQGRQLGAQLAQEPVVDPRVADEHLQRTLSVARARRAYACGRGAPLRGRRPPREPSSAPSRRLRAMSPSPST